MPGIVVAGHKYTARKLIRQAFKRLGVIGGSEQPEAAEADDALEMLQGMIDAWQTKQLTLTHIDRHVFELTLGQVDYSIGLGASNDWQVVRPTFVNSATLVDDTGSQTLEYPMTVMTLSQFQEARSTQWVRGRPGGVYYDRGVGVADQQLAGRMWLNREPDRAAYKVALWLGEPLTNFADMDTEFFLPPGYGEAIKYNLAKRMMSDFGKPFDRLLVREARESLADVKGSNTADRQQDGVRDLEPLFNNRGLANNRLGSDLFYYD